MPRPATELTDGELRNVIDNFRRNKLTSDGRYLAAMEELERRKGGGLDFNKTLRAVLSAAREHRYLSYAQLADESGVEWSKARYAMNSHLGHLLDYAHGKGWPLLSAIVVNKEHLADGGMEPATLKGFVTAAAALGYVITDERAFLSSQQKAVFDWATSFQDPNNADP